MDWSRCSDAEQIDGKVSRPWLVKGMRIPLHANLDNAGDFTPEQIAAEAYEGLQVDRARRSIAFARSQASHSA